MGSVYPVGVVYVPSPDTVTVSVSTVPPPGVQGEGDRAGREIGAGKSGRIHKGHRRCAQRDLVGLGVVASAGLAGSPCTCSSVAPFSLARCYCCRHRIGGVPLVGARTVPVVGSVYPVGVVYVPSPVTVTVSVSTVPPLPALTG